MSLTAIQKSENYKIRIDEQPKTALFQADKCAKFESELIKLVLDKL